MSKQKQIAVLGECMIEVRPKKNGDKYSGLSIGADIAFGGDTLNFSIYLARQGIDVSYVTALGDDPISDWIVDEWQREGVGCELVSRNAGQCPGLYLIDVDKSGERSFFYWRDNSPARRLIEEGGPRLLESLESFQNIYLSGITLGIYETSARETLFQFLQGFRQRGGKIFFDNNYRARQWPDAVDAMRAFERMYRLTDVALPTADDEYELFGDKSEQDVIERLLSYGIPEIVLKQGPAGCVVVSSEGQESVPTKPVDQVVDTTAAGDSFNAGYVGARLGGGDPREAASNGNRIAGVVVQHRGAIVPADLFD